MCAGPSAQVLPLRVGDDFQRYEVTAPLVVIGSYVTLITCGCFKAIRNTTGRISADGCSPGIARSIAPTEDCRLAVSSTAGINEAAMTDCLR